MPTLNWPTATVVIVIIAAWAALLLGHVAIPPVLAAIFASVGSIVTAVLPRLFGGKDTAS